MSNLINFELVSPEKKLLSESVYMAVMPGDMGDFGVLAGHASLVSSLKPGVVRVYKQQGAKPEKIFIAGGFADVTGQNCTLLAEEAVNIEELDKDKLGQELADLTEDLGMVSEKADKVRVQKKIHITKAKLQAIA